MKERQPPEKRKTSLDRKAPKPTMGKTGPAAKKIKNVDRMKNEYYDSVKKAGLLD